MSQSNIIYSRISEIQQASNNIIHCDDTNEWVTVYFKEANTTNTKYYNIKINWTITQFLGIVKEWIIQDFNLDDRDYPNYSINIIEMCQEIPGVKSEDAPKMEEEQTTYYNKFINNKWVGFYFKVEITE
jgi:putative methionine-R-sulfoxide reductase with GAF domain